MEKSFHLWTRSAPSPALSSFVIYEGDMFPKWQGHLIVGSLKAGTLYRLLISNGEIIETEILIDNIARIRDVEITPDGEILLLLEHATGGQILRLVRD